MQFASHSMSIRLQKFNDWCYGSIRTVSLHLCLHFISINVQFGFSHWIVIMYYYLSFNWFFFLFVNTHYTTFWTSSFGGHFSRNETIIIHPFGKLTIRSYDRSRSLFSPFFHSFQVSFDVCSFCIFNYSRGLFTQTTEFVCWKEKRISFIFVDGCCCLRHFFPLHYCNREILFVHSSLYVFVFFCLLLRAIKFFVNTISISLVSVDSTIH